MPGAAHNDILATDAEVLCHIGNTASNGINHSRLPRKWLVFINPGAFLKS